MDTTNNAHSASLLRGLPSVNRLLSAPTIATLLASQPKSVVTACTREILESIRKEILSQTQGSELNVPGEEAILSRIVARVEERTRRTLRPAINATGVVLHTGLGRARLPEVACDALYEVARQHSLVEIDPASGQRGSRQAHVRDLLCELTGAEEALVLNNCAAAIFLAVNAIAIGREVIISRGELVEIGGAFRIPDIIRQSGATLVEVGTTNKTRISDYANAITEKTALILRCHPSNFAIIGFTESASTEELVALGRSHNVPVMEDQGSGALYPLHSLGMPGLSGSLVESVQAGYTVITASGDKLLGATQAGILLGKREVIRDIAQHPLARALRIDKLTLAVLEATLRLYRDPAEAREAIPTLRYLYRTPSEIRTLAQRLQRGLRRSLPKEQYAVALQNDFSEVGGGSLPGQSLPTVCVALKCTTTSVEGLAKRLREGEPAVFPRIRQDTLLFDLRTVEDWEIALIIQAFANLTSSA